MASRYSKNCQKEQEIEEKGGPGQNPVEGPFPNAM